MKSFIIGLFIIPNILFAQTKANTSDKVSVKKELSDDKADYSLEGIVQIQNGKDDDIDVKFTAVVPVDVWDKNWKKSSYGEKKYFDMIAGILTVRARYSLKNTLSFEPFSKEFFMWKDGKYMSSYKMSGKNGYGNQIETSALVEYDPEEKTKTE